jgi:O-antigen ligase
VGQNPLAPVLSGSSELVQRITSTRYDPNSQPRIELYRRTPALIADHPLFGVGANNFREYGRQYGFIDVVNGNSVSHAHNIPLTIAAERGLVGLAAVVWLVLALVRNLRVSARAADELDRTLAVAIGGALMVLLLEGMVDYGLGTNAIFGTVIILAACTNVLARRAAAQPRHA